MAKTSQVEEKNINEYFYFLMDKNTGICTKSYHLSDVNCEGKYQKQPLRNKYRPAEQQSRAEYTVGTVAEGSRHVSFCVFQWPSEEALQSLTGVKNGFIHSICFWFWGWYRGMYCLGGYNLFYFFFFSLPFSLEETNAFSVYLEIERLHWDMFETVFVATCT